MKSQMRKIKSSNFLINQTSPPPCLPPPPHHLPYCLTTLPTRLTIPTIDRIINISPTKSKLPEHHPLKFFLESHHQSSYQSSYLLPPLNHSILLSFKFKISKFNNPHPFYFDSARRHSFHLNRPYRNLINQPPPPPESINHFPELPTSGPSLHPSPLDSIHSKTSNDPINHSWWRCSIKPQKFKASHPSKLSKDLSNLRSTHNLEDRNKSYADYLTELSNLQNSSRTIRDLNQNLKELLKDETKFRENFDRIWSDWNSTQERLDREDRSNLTELQRETIESILKTIIDSVNQLSIHHSRDHHKIDKLEIFDELFSFLITNQDKSDRIISTLGLDPIRGWRNSIKENLRIRTLKTLVSSINLLNSELLTWWSSEISNIDDDNPAQFAKFSRLGIFLILALSKEGSVSKASKVFWMMDKFPRFDGQSQFVSHERRAATALVLVDALWSCKKLDAANRVLETVLVGEWLGPIYRRYLLTMLMVKAARGEIQQVERIGSIYEHAWVNSNEVDLIAGKNKRTRIFHLQDPRILVARAKIEALGILGETRGAIETFQETIRMVPPKLDVSSQLPDLHAEMMRVHLKADDPRAIEQNLKRMIATPDPYGLNQPDQRHYNILLQAYANRMDIEGCSSALDRMLSYGVRPDIYTYGNICLLFSNLGEPELIREVIQALSEFSSSGRSLRLNRELWNILLDAYIESGDWSRTARLLECLELDDFRRHDSDVVTNGCVLKALVLSGSPTDKVLETFKSMYNDQTGLTPDVRSYTLLLLSICDSGMMDLAETVFHILKKNHNNDGKHEDGRRGLAKPNVYMYGIMISAYLRLGKPEIAQDYFRQMQQAGIRPNLVIYSMLTSAYAASRSSTTTKILIEGEGSEQERREDGVRVAYEMAARFRRELLDDDAYLKGRQNDLNGKTFIESSNLGERPFLRKKLFSRLLGPIIQSYAKSARPAKALEVFRELVASLESEYSVISKDGRPIDLDIFTMLMDGYRKAQDPVGVMEVWKELFRLATENNESFNASEKLLNKVTELIRSEGLTTNRSDDHQPKTIVSGVVDEQRGRRRANKLCLALSIYTDCLSRHGYHEEIANTWYEVQHHGFGFDAGNWNELCAAMFRSGNHRMGWWISERIFYGLEDGSSEADAELRPQTKEVDEETKWLKLLSRTVGFRSGRSVLGLEGTRLSGAQKTESPLRPPNRTSIRKTWRFDNESATRMSVEGLLNWLKDPDSIVLNQEVDSSYSITKRSSGSQQLDYISQVRRELAWRPYEKVFRMLHGSMWRECSDLVIKKWEELLARNEGERGGENGVEKGKMSLEANMLEVEEIMKVSVKEVVGAYQQKYPNTIVEVLAMNDTEKVPIGMNKENLIKWNHDDFIIRVIRRTFERIREWPKT